MTRPERWHKTNVHDTAFTMEIHVYVYHVFSVFEGKGFANSYDKKLPKFTVLMFLHCYRFRSFAIPNDAKNIMSLQIRLTY